MASVVLLLEAARVVSCKAALDSVPLATAPAAAVARTTLHVDGGSRGGADARLLLAGRGAPGGSRGQSGTASRGSSGCSRSSSVGGGGGSWRVATFAPRPLSPRGAPDAFAQCVACILAAACSSSSPACPGWSPLVTRQSSARLQGRAWATRARPAALARPMEAAGLQGSRGERGSPVTGQRRAMRKVRSEPIRQ